MDNELIIKRLKQAYNCRIDDELADKMDISRQTIQDWKRKKMNFEKIIEKTEDISLNYIFRGQGEMMMDAATTMLNLPAAAEYATSATLQTIVKKQEEEIKTLREQRDKLQFDNGRLTGIIEILKDMQKEKV